jgi:hypothetical protein
MGKTRHAYRIIVGNCQESYHLEDQKGDGKIILMRVIRK